MCTQEDIDFVEALFEWAESFGINLDRDPEQLQLLNTQFVKQKNCKIYHEIYRNNQTRARNCNAL